LHGTRDVHSPKQPGERRPEGRSEERGGGQGGRRGDEKKRKEKSNKIRTNWTSRPVPPKAGSIVGGGLMALVGPATIYRGLDTGHSALPRMRISALSGRRSSSSPRSTEASSSDMSVGPAQCRGASRPPPSLSFTCWGLRTKE